MAEQVAKLEIQVNLRCPRCCRKIKKILCEIPYVKDQVFDEKKNTVTITVVCCSPENVRQKILCKGRCIVECVKILPAKIEVPKPPKTDDKTKPDGAGSSQGGKKEEKPDGAGSSQGGKEEKDQPKPAPPVPADPPVCVMGWVCVCTPCHNRGCGSSCPCSCHRGCPPMCADGCGRPAHECRCWRPPLCRDGCGRPADECRCRRPSRSRCCDRCNNENACSSWAPCGCDCGRPPVCTNAGHECESSCSLM